MTNSRGARAAFALLLIATLSCAKRVAHSTDHTPATPARYLFAWTGDEDREHSDFLAVIDLARDGDRYGTIVATAPVGERGLWPHHTEHELGPGKELFANGFSSNRTLLFDLHEPRHPTVVERFDGVAGLSFLHSFVRLPNGHVLATFQAHGPDNIRFGWAGSMEERRPHYYRIQGPSFLLEYDNTRNGSTHIHSVWRVFDEDFGQGLV